MPSNKLATEPIYTIWLAGGAGGGNGTRTGSAYQLLDAIREDAATRSEEVRKLTTEGYASVIVSDAAFFLPKDLLSFLRTQSYESAFDRALRYLAEMPNSGVRILTKKEHTGDTAGH